MRIDAIVREVSPADDANYATGPHGERVFMGHPLSDYLPRMLRNDGYLEVPLPPGPLAGGGAPQLNLAGPKVEEGVTMQAIAADTVRISLKKFLHRDPDTTFLRIAFEFHPSDQAELDEMVRKQESANLGFE
jgi:hypothetical protein